LSFRSLGCYALSNYINFCQPPDQNWTAATADICDSAVPSEPPANIERLRGQLAYLTILTLGLLLGWDQIVQIYEGKVFSKEGLRQSSSGTVLRSGGWRTW